MQLLMNLLLIFHFNLFYFSTSTVANLIQNPQLTSHDNVLYQLQQPHQQQQQHSLYSSFHNQLSQDHLKANLNNNLDKDDSSLFKTSSSPLSTSSQSSSSSAPSLSSSILSSILNGQLPIDEQDAYKLLQHLKSQSSEEFHNQPSTLSSLPSNLNSAPLSSQSQASSSSSSSPLLSTTTVTPSLQSPPPISLPSSSSSFNSFISSIFPTLWAANNNLNSQQSSYKNDDSFKSRILPPIYIQPVVIPYPLVINPMQNNFISDYTSRFMMSGYSNDLSSLSPATSTVPPTMTSFSEEYEKDTMARGNIRRSGISAYTANSPIYYVRLPSPTPITLYPTISYATNTGSSVSSNSRPTRTFNPNSYRNPFAVQINAPQPVQTITAYSPQQLSSQSTSSVIPTLSPILNLPISFISNGKPNGIYELTTSDNTLGTNSVASISSPGDSIQFTYHPQRIPTNHYSQTASYNPFISNHQNGVSTGTNSFYRPSIIRPHSHPNYEHLNDIIGNADSKITNLKRQYFFNGKPEEIYVLSQPASTENQYQFQHSIYPTFQTSHNEFY